MRLTKKVEQKCKTKTSGIKITGTKCKMVMVEQKSGTKN